MGVARRKAREAQRRQQEFQAQQARSQATNLLSDTAENARRFNERAEGTLSQGVAVLGKTGSLGFARNAGPETGIELGQKVDDGGLSAEVSGLESKLAEAREREEQRQASGFNNSGEDTGSTNMVNRGGGYIRGLEKELEEKQGQLSKFNELRDVANIEGPGSMSFATGSDLLSMATTRDKMERDKRDFMRRSSRDAAAAFDTGEMFDTQAELTRQAGQFDVLSGIFDTATSILGLGSTMGLFGS